MVFCFENYSKLELEEIIGIQKQEKLENIISFSKISFCLSCIRANKTKIDAMHSKLETRKYVCCISGQLRIANEFTSLVFVRYHSRSLRELRHMHLEPLCCKKRKKKFLTTTYLQRALIPQPSKWSGTIFLLFLTESGSIGSHHFFTTPCHLQTYILPKSSKIAKF